MRLLFAVATLLSACQSPLSAAQRASGFGDEALCQEVVSDERYSVHCVRFRSRIYKQKPAAQTSPTPNRNWTIKDQDGGPVVEEKTK